MGYLQYQLVSRISEPSTVSRHIHLNSSPRENECMSPKKGNVLIGKSIAFQSSFARGENVTPFFLEYPVRASNLDLFKADFLRIRSDPMGFISIFHHLEHIFLNFLEPPKIRKSKLESSHVRWLSRKFVVGVLGRPNFWVLLIQSHEAASW